MTINYTSWTTGDNLTGDGSPGNPFKTITKASEGLVGGDEVRVEKSPDAVALSGTIAWVQGSRTFTTSADLTGELYQGDFIAKREPGWPFGETYWEVNGVGADFVEIYGVYPEETETIASYKCGTTDTDSDPTSVEIVQEILTSGVSDNYITVSGGWDLSTETQTGHTYFRQVHSTFQNRYGYGLLCACKYVDISSLSFFRYRYGMAFSGADNINVSNSHLNSNGSYGFYSFYNSGGLIVDQVICGWNLSYGAYFYGLTHSTITNLRSLSGSSSGFYMYNCYSNTFTSCKSRYNNGYGLYLRYIEDCNFTSLTVDNNSNYGMYMYYCFTNRFTSLNDVNNSRGFYFSRSSLNVFSDVLIEDNTYGIYSYRSFLNRFYNTTMQGNTTPFYIYARGKSEIPVFSIERYQEDNLDVWYFDDGNCETCRSSGFFLDVESIKFHSTTNDQYIYHSWFAKVCKGQSRPLSIYMRDNEIDHPIVYGTLYFKEKAVSAAIPFDLTPPGWNKFEITPISPNYIIDDGELELRIQVTGNCDAWADRFSEYTSEDLMAELTAHRESTEPNLQRVLTATEIRQVTVVDPLASDTEFITDLTELADGFWNRGALVFTSGSNKGIMRKIQNYYPGDKKIKVQTALPFTPGNGDTLIIVPARAFRFNYADINDTVDKIYEEVRIDHDTAGTYGEVWNDVWDKLPDNYIMGSSEGTDFNDEINAIQAKTDLLTFDAQDNVHSVPKDPGVLDSYFADIYNMVADPNYGLEALKDLLEAIDTSDEMAMRFDEIKGDGWTDETLREIKKGIDNVAGRYWSDEELSDIRGALGIEGDKTTPVDGQLQDIMDATDLIGGVRTQTDKLKFAQDNDVKATLEGEKVNLTDPTEAKLDSILSDTEEIELVKSQTDKMQFAAGNDIKATIDGEQVVVDPVIPLTLELLKKMGTNRLELSPGSVDNWILYNDDDTPLLTFSVRDKSGFAIEIADGAPARRSKAV